VTTTRLVRMALALAVLSTTLTLASLALMIANGFDVGGIFWPALVLVGTTYAWVGVRVVTRESRNAVGWLLLLGACCWAVNSFAEQYAWFAFNSSMRLPGASFGAWLGSWIWLLGTVMLLILMPIYFPDGLLPSRRWSPVVAAVVVAGLVTALGQAVVAWGFRDDVPLLIMGNFDPTEDPSLAGTVAGVGNVLIFLVGIPLAPIAVALRWRASTGVRRLQIRWFVSAMAVSAVFAVVSSASSLTGELSGLVSAVLTLVAMALPPISIGIAILRYRLYDIDRIVSRTIAYGVVTVVLAAVFGGAVVLLSTVLSQVAQGQTIAVAASTLAVFALFQPVRRRVQGVIDRRFDRSRYDAELTAAAFAARLRHETDMATVTQDLARTANSTVAPASLAIWLRTRAAGR